MRILKLVFVLLSLAVVSGCATKFKTYNGPEVTRVAVWKDARMMRL